MIDTVRFKVGMFPKSPAEIQSRPGWKVSRSTGREMWFSDGGHLALEEFTVAQHETSDLRAAWKGGTMVEAVVEVSLPKALFGGNGQLLQDDQDISDALHVVEGLLADLGTPYTIVDGSPAWLPEYSRVDLVWHFAGSPAEWIVAHANGGHPLVRKAPQQFFGETLFFNGKEVGIRIYDKELEANGKPGDVVRVEVELKGKRLKQSLGEYFQDDTTRLHVWHLPFARCWQVYREVCVAFEPKDLVQLPKGRSIVPFMAMMVAEGIRLQGVPFIDLVHVQYSHSTYKRVRALAKTYRAEYTGIRWHDLVPEAGPVVKPPEVLPKSKEDKSSLAA